MASSWSPGQQQTQQQQLQSNDDDYYEGVLEIIMVTDHMGSSWKKNKSIKIWLFGVEIL